MKNITINLNVIILLLLLISLFSFSMWTRMGTMKSKVILDYDPWYQYRLAKDILENNLKRPEWDLLTFSPPGRPFDVNLGWEYTMIFFYKILSLFIRDFTFMDAAKLSPAIMVGLASAAAFLLGKLLTNKWGGIVTGIFAASTPAFIGVSMAGYCDTDVVVVLYSFVCIYSIILALKKKKIQYFVFALLLNLFFIYNWFFGWFISFFFLAFIPVIFGYKIFEDLIYNKKINLTKTWKNNKSIIIPIFIFVVSMNIAALILGFGTIIDFVITGLGFTGGSGGEIVNVSVAELQPISILTKAGFMSVAGRVGIAPMLLFIIGLPLLVVYKIYKKEKIDFVEIFLFMWSALTFYLILHGVRFSLLFSCAVTSAAGYVVGSLVKRPNLGFLIFPGYFLIYSILISSSLLFTLISIVVLVISLFVFFDLEKKGDMENNFVRSTVFGIIALLVFMFISDTLVYANQSSGMEVGQNWLDMLDWLNENADPNAEVATWWDPGHIIAGYTDLRVHADGAHCSEDLCVPYGHDTRIQDMGRMMSTSNETETVELLKKYMVLSDEDCEKVKEKYGDIVPKEACESASEMYFIASSDLIGKFTWMDYYGGYRAPIASSQDFERNPGVCCPSTPKTEPGQMSCGEFADQGRGVWVWCPWIFNFVNQQQDQEGNPVYVYDYSGLKMAIVQKGENLIPIYNNKYVINNMIFYSNGQEQKIDLSNSNINLEKIDGLVWVDPSFRNLIYFSPSTKESIFTRLFFFNGEGLEHFDLVFSNSEIKLFKVKF